LHTNAAIESAGGGESRRRSGGLSANGQLIGAAAALAAGASIGVKAAAYRGVKQRTGKESNRKSLRQGINIAK